MLEICVLKKVMNWPRRTAWISTFLVFYFKPTSQPGAFSESREIVFNFASLPILCLIVGSWNKILWIEVQHVLLRSIASNQKVGISVHLPPIYELLQSSMLHGKALMTLRAGNVPCHSALNAFFSLLGDEKTKAYPIEFSYHLQTRSVEEIQAWSRQTDLCGS